MNIPDFEEIVEQNDQTEARRLHLEHLRELVGNVYPNKFERSRISGSEDTITNLLGFEPVAEITDEIVKVVKHLNPGERPPVEIKDSLNERLRKFGNVRIAGRMAVPPRVMGKAAFVHLSDGISRLQIYVRRDDVHGVYNGDKNPVTTVQGSDTVNGWEVFQLLDHGDFIGVEGYLFVTNTGELSIHVEKLQFLAKAMLPMPDKMHGIADPEIRQRQRYADLIASSLQIEHEGLTTREVFERRAKVISSLRRFLEDHGYIEVETPMLTPKATGAAAKPFKTHHNALDIDLYARIAPELYLKRLVVGGFEKVYELNRNFRNEGISYKHNPEFTMLEFYCSYMDVNGMMDFCEELMKESVRKTTGGLVVEYQGNRVDFSRFERISMKRAIVEYWRDDIGELGTETLEPRWLDDITRLRRLWAFYLIWRLHKTNTDFRYAQPNSDPEEWLREKAKSSVQLFKNEWWEKSANFSSSVPSFEEAFNNGIIVNDDRFAKLEYEFLLGNFPSSGKPDDHLANELLLRLFEALIESRLIGPTFIVDYPKSISPLSKASPENPRIAERFELFINGMEVANGFSELNDPKEQYERFVDQMSARERGDEEAMILDEDYIRALSYGMPPAAGIGIGIDRLVMLLTNKHSIRDVILFPHMRPERNQAAEEINPE